MPDSEERTPRSRGKRRGTRVCVDRDDTPRLETKSHKRSSPTAKARTVSRTRTAGTGGLSTTPARVGMLMTASRISALTVEALQQRTEPLARAS